MNDKLFSESLKKSLYDNCRRRETREREAAQGAAMKQMQAEIHQLFLDKAASGHRSASQLSLVSDVSASALSASVVSTQFQVEDDYGDISEGQSGISC